MSASDSSPRLGTTEQEPVQDSVAQDSVAQLLADWARERPDLDFSPVGVINRLARVMTQLALTSGTISLRVDRLAKRGIVTREADPDDKRGQRVRLTAEGLRLFDKVAPLHLANEERLLSSLTHDERVTLARLLSKLLISFESGTVQAGLPLGMRLEPAHLARYRRTAAGLSDTPGLLVAETIEGTPAASAGLARGDLIVAVDGIECRSEDVLAQAIDRVGPAGRLRLSVLRGNNHHQVTVTAPARRES